MIPCVKCGKENNILSRRQSPEFICWNCSADLEEAIAEWNSKNPDNKNNTGSKTAPNIICTKCHGAIDSETAQISKAYIKCQHCGYWEDYPNDKNSISTSATEADFICPHCETSNKSNAIYCRKCGKKLIEMAIRTVKYCEKCESEYEETDDFCQNDGNKLIFKEIEVDPADLQPATPAANKQEIISKEIAEDKLGFGLANLWIGIQALSVVGWIALAFSLYSDSGEPILFTIALFSLPSALTAYGVHSRTSWGLFATYTYLVLFLITGVIKFFPENPILGGMQFLIATMWYVYFSNRSKYFTK